MRKPNTLCILSLCLSGMLCPGGLCQEEVRYIDVVERDAFIKSKHFLPVFAKRLQAIREQIDMAVSKGWIGTDEAERLKSEQSRLQVVAEGLGQREPTQAEADELDRNITRLNAEVHRAMQSSAAPSVPGESTDDTSASGSVTPLPARTAPAKTNKRTNNSGVSSGAVAGVSAGTMKSATVKPAPGKAKATRK